MKKLFKNILIISLIVSGCSAPPTEPDYDNPYDEQGEDYIPPAITEITPADGSEVNSRDVTISWTGTSVVEKYEYSFNGGSFVETSDSTLFLSDLDEGIKTFSIKPLKADKDTSITFTVNAIPGPGIVFSPRVITADTTDTTVSLILEEVENFMGAHIEIYCDNDCPYNDTYRHLLIFFFL